MRNPIYLKNDIVYIVILHALQIVQPAKIEPWKQKRDNFKRSVSPHLR